MRIVVKPCKPDEILGICRRYDVSRGDGDTDPLDVLEELAERLLIDLGSCEFDDGVDSFR